MTQQLSQKFALERESEFALRSNNFEALFKLFVKIENAMAIAGGEEIGEALDSRLDDLLNIQSVVMSTASSLHAKTPQEILYKLAIWRWDEAELNSPGEHLQRGTAVAYSAYRDLVEMMDDKSVLTRFDQDNLSLLPD